MKAAIAILALALLTACGAFFKSVDEVNNPKDDQALAHCRDEGRDAKAASDSGAVGYGVYLDCTKEAGLQ